MGGLAVHQGADRVHAHGSVDVQSGRVTVRLSIALFIYSIALRFILHLGGGILVLGKSHGDGMRLTGTEARTGLLGALR